MAWGKVQTKSRPMPRYWLPCPPKTKASLPAFSGPPVPELIGGQTAFDIVPKCRDTADEVILSGGGESQYLDVTVPGYFGLGREVFFKDNMKIAAPKPKGTDARPARMAIFGKPGPGG